MERRRGCDEMGEIKKGPWKAEEDEVLIKHVKKYGSRDWSSIRSKGLLHRTGKSCRLRWVNKLRPNLKNGVKFSAEEERVVIDLQGQFGNKWAKIATYLPGRTDNDVKNFWSSRQKRLTRVLQSPPPKSQKSNKESPALHKVPILEAPKFSSSTEESLSSPKTQSCTSPYIDDTTEQFKMVSLPELVNPNSGCLLGFEQNHQLLPLGFVPTEKNLMPNAPPQPPPALPLLPLLQTEIPLPLESQELFIRLGDPNFFSVFGHGNASEMIQLPFVPPGIKAESCGNDGKRESDSLMMSPDTFMDDFPMDMFDNIEPLLSPSDW